jgi:hypothetical protein
MPALVLDDAMECGSAEMSSSSCAKRERSNCACRETNDGSPQQTSFYADYEEMSCPLPKVDSMEIKKSRECEGRCADCGMQTHEFHADPLTGSQVKVPLTIAREVHRGRCLFCFPVFPQEFLNHHHPQHQQEQRAPSKPMFTQSNSCSYSFYNVPTASSPHSSRRLPQGVYHRPSDPMVQHSLAVLQSNTFDIVDILSAMKRVPHDIVVQEKGCERLWILSWEDENSAAIGRVGGITIVLDAMARFPMNAHLQQCGCESLQNLALNNYNRREICDLGGVVLIVQAMMRHVDVAGIQQCGCTALASIATCQDHHKDITRVGGFHAIVIAARNFADEESVLRAAYDAVYALGFDPAGRLPRRPEVPVKINPSSEEWR